MEHKTLNELLKAKLGMKVDEFSKISNVKTGTLRNWFKNEDKHAILNLAIDGVKFRNGWTR